MTVQRYWRSFEVGGRGWIDLKRSPFGGLGYVIGIGASEEVVTKYASPLF